MIKNYLVVALRTLQRHKGYTLINVLGLATGVACCLFLLLFVRDELSYDRFHEHVQDLYRINLVFPDRDRQIALTPTAVAPVFMRELPEVKNATRVEASSGLIKLGDQVFNERRFYYADSSVFDVFTFPLISGDPKTVLSRPNTVVITRSIADKYFGSTNPIGQTIVRNNDRSFEITGVMEDVPANSHIQFDFLASFASREYWANREIWDSANFYTYVRLIDGVTPEQIGEKVADLVARNVDPERGERQIVFQPLAGIHLSTGIDYELDSSGEMSYVIGFTTLAILILLMACINYMNLATARSTLRAKEVGLRKSLGAFREQLAGQFYGEASVLTFGALLLALAIVTTGLPRFNSVSGKQFDYLDLTTAPIVVLILGIFLVVSIVAGSYPALFLSRMNSVRALRGQSNSGRGTVRIRQGLVILQFGVTTFLIVGTLVVGGQLRFMQSQHLGFDKEHVVDIPINDPEVYRGYSTIRELLSQSSSIVAVSAVNQIPGNLGWTSRFRTETMTDEESFSIKGMPVEKGVVDALGLEIIAGRPYDEFTAIPDSVDHQFILNETTIKRLGWSAEEAIGRRVAVPPREGVVRAVVKDFNISSLHDVVEPLAIWYQPNEIQHIVVRIKPGQATNAIADMSRIWTGFAPAVPFSYRFLDSVYDALYTNEQQVTRVMSVFSVLAIGIACLGLLGLASFTVDRRTREIGVRKVLGASVTSIVQLLSRDFLVLVGAAFVLAAPFAWISLSRWLEGFAYRTSLGPGAFVLAAIAILMIAIIAVSSQAIRAALADPVASLRSD